MGQHIVQIAGNGRVDYEIVADDIQAIHNAGFFLAESNDVVRAQEGKMQATGWLDSPSTNAVNGDSFLVSDTLHSITIESGASVDDWIVVDGKAMSEAQAKSIINAQSKTPPTEDDGGFFGNIPREALILTAIILLIAVSKG